MVLHFSLFINNDLICKWGDGGTAHNMNIHELDCYFYSLFQAPIHFLFSVHSYQNSYVLTTSKKSLYHYYPSLYLDLGMMIDNKSPIGLQPIGPLANTSTSIQSKPDSSTIQVV